MKGTARLIWPRKVQQQAAVNTVINLQFPLKVWNFETNLATATCSNCVSSYQMKISRSNIDIFNLSRLNFNLIHTLFYKKTLACTNTHTHTHICPLLHVAAATAIFRKPHQYIKSSEIWYIL